MYLNCMIGSKKMVKVNHDSAEYKANNLLLANKYNDWASNNKHVVQISMQRSGRAWFVSLYKLITKEDVTYFEKGIFESKYYFHTHLYYWLPIRDGVKYILLLRDPRDVILSLLNFGVAKSKKDYDTIYETDINLIKHFANNWLKYLKLLKYNTVVIQYERLCLYPISTIWRVLDFVDRKPIQPIEEAVKFFDKDIDATHRYSNHCLKWKQDEQYRDKFVPIIWDVVKDIAPYFGYLEDGHSTNLVSR